MMLGMLICLSNVGTSAESSLPHSRWSPGGADSDCETCHNRNRNATQSQSQSLANGVHIALIRLSSSAVVLLPGVKSYQAPSLSSLPSSISLPTSSCPVSSLHAPLPHNIDLDGGKHFLDLNVRENPWKRVTRVGG